MQDTDVDNDVTVQAAPTGDIGPATTAGKHFVAVSLLDSTGSATAQYQADVLALCTPDEAALLRDGAFTNPPHGRIDSTRAISSEWLADKLAKVSVPVNLAGVEGGPGSTIVLTLNGSSGTWLISDIDLVKAS